MLMHVSEEVTKSHVHSLLMISLHFFCWSWYNKGYGAIVLVDTHVFYIPVYIQIYLCLIYIMLITFLWWHHDTSFYTRVKKYFGYTGGKYHYIHFYHLDSREFFKFSRIFVLIMNSSLIDFYVKFFRDSKWS